MSASDKTSAADHAAAAMRPLRDGIDTVREQSQQVAASASETAQAALHKTRDGVAKARETGANGVDANPLIALAGGIAIGAVIGALLPRTEREAALLGDLGNRLNAGARDAVIAAKEAGRDKFAELGFSSESAQGYVKSIVDALLSAVTTAASAAIDAAKDGSAAKSDD